MEFEFEITSEADDIHLLTVQERRLAINIDAGDASQDTALASRSLEASEWIATECRVNVANTGTVPLPTLKQETINQTFRCARHEKALWLARRFNIAIHSIAVDGVALATNEYLCNSESGKLVRLSSGREVCWYGTEIIVSYDAGFDDDSIPPGLKRAAADRIRAIGYERDRDPFVKSQSQEIPGVLTERTDLWVGGLPGQNPLTAMDDPLQRFRNGPAIG